MRSARPLPDRAVGDVELVLSHAADALLRMTKRSASPAPRGRRVRNPAIDLSDPWEIASLPPRTAPYWMALGRGRALGLTVCSETGRPLKWHARLRLRDGGKYRKKCLGAHSFLSLADAAWLARRWFDKQAASAVPRETSRPGLPAP